jgi:hypothetical protein
LFNILIIVIIIDIIISIVVVVVVVRRRRCGSSGLRQRRPSNAARGETGHRRNNTTGIRIIIGNSVIVGYCCIGGSIRNDSGRLESARRLDRLARRRRCAARQPRDAETAAGRRLDRLANSLLLVLCVSIDDWHDDV